MWNIFCKCILSLICFTRIDFSEQYHIKGLRCQMGWEIHFAVFISKSQVYSCCIHTHYLGTSWLTFFFLLFFQEVLHVAQCEMQYAASAAFLQILQKNLVPIQNYTQTFLQTILNSVDGKDPGKNNNSLIRDHSWQRCRTKIFFPSEDISLLRTKIYFNYSFYTVKISKQIFVQNFYCSIRQIDLKKKKGRYM